MSRNPTGLIAAAFFASALLAGCESTVHNYGLDDHFSPTEATAGSSSTPEQCAQTLDAVWVEGATFRECIRYFPSTAFKSGHVDRAVVFMEGDWLSTSGASPYYGKWSPRRELNASEVEQERGGLPYVTIARPGTDGSSGNQNLRRTRYETLVMNAALEKIKTMYGIKQLALVGQSGGGGLVAALIAERNDVLCAVSSSGVTSVVYRAQASGRASDYTGQSFGSVWDPIDQLPRVHPMPGFRMFVTSDASDTDVDFGSQDHYVQAAKAAGLPIYQIMVHASGPVHHQTYRIGNRVAEDCMLGLSTDQIVRTYSGMTNNFNHMDEIAAQERSLARGHPVLDTQGKSDGRVDRDSGVGR